MIIFTLIKDNIITYLQSDEVPQRLRKKIVEPFNMADQDHRKVVKEMFDAIEESKGKDLYYKPMTDGRMINIIRG